MFDITKADKNFKVEKHRDFGETAFYNAQEKPFEIYGLINENGAFRRLPEKVASSVNDGVKYLHTNTAGGRVRFSTDSPFTAIRTKMNSIGKMPHFALSGSAGFDLYEYDGEKNVYLGTFMPPYDLENGYESIIRFPDRRVRELLINFPTYSNVENLEIGLAPDAAVSPAKKYKIEKPVVFYGSSITQGGCCSRPGSTYQARLSAEFGFDYINLGFSGSARGEKEIAEYIASLDMSVFVLDYDHNAPDPEHLQNTHEAFFRLFREKQPMTPVVFMSRPKFILNKDEQTRRSIVEKTFKNALSAGDRNVYFIDGLQLTDLCGAEGTVDDCHPTDLGFFSMAQALSPAFKKIFG